MEVTDSKIVLLGLLVGYLKFLLFSCVYYVASDGRAIVGIMNWKVYERKLSRTILNILF